MATKRKQITHLFAATPEEFEKIKLAAESLGLGMTPFLRMSAMQIAAKTLAAMNNPEAA